MLLSSLVYAQKNCYSGMRGFAMPNILQIKNEQQKFKSPVSRQLLTVETLQTRQDVTR